MRRHLPDLPIHTRIALWIGGISTILLVSMALAVYGVFAEQIAADLDQTIVLRSASYEQLVDQSTFPPVLRIAVPEVDLGSGEGVLRLYTSDGTLLQDASPSAAGSAEETALVRRAGTTQQQELATIDLSDDEDYRLLARPLSSEADGVILVSGLELSRVNGPLQLLRAILIIAVPVTVIGAGMGGYWIASRALQPVADMAETARRITDGDLAQRVPGAGSADELGQLATTLNVMIDRIDETIRRERRFTADASHELRTPLAAIDATIDVTLGRPREAATYQQALGEIRGQTARLAQLTRQLLLLSRLDSAALRSGFAPVDLDELLLAVCEPYQADSSALTLVVDIAPGSHVVLGDFELLARAFLNIVDNAVKHAGNEVTLAIGLRDEGGDQVISFADDGVGIPTAAATSVFERFHRGDSARQTPGSGLGLSIVQAIVEVHGGSVAIGATETGAGTRLILHLPAMARPEARG